ncbi:MAG: hypothetical protein M0R21_11580 [Lentimicrobiaceae bacterium]|jgi:hypothetical protein|nr:hypothetical protein [Lentimicrobiaceae bacterium]
MKKNKLLWIPASLTIMYILFISLFALDSFNTKETVTEQMASAVVHLIPPVILLVLLVFTWRFPVAGGVFFFFLGIFSVFFFNTYKAPLNFLAISLPIFLSGLLFILFSKQKKQD